MIETPVLVEDPDWRWRSSPTYQGMFFGSRTLPPVSTNILPLFPVLNVAERWEEFRDRFTSVYAVVEFYSQTGTPPVSFNSVLYFKKSNRVDTPEDPPYPRTNHAGAFFQFQRHYAAQLVGYTVYVPDLCDDPWLEQVHRPPNPELAWYPFRQPTPVPIQGQQFNLFFNQPKPWPVDAEQDTVFRKPDVGILVLYPRPVVQLTMPNLIGLDLQTALAVAAANFLNITNLDFEDTVYPILPLPRGTVIQQYPQPGAVISIDQPTIVICSSGLMNLPQVGDSVANPVNVVIGPNKLN